jgi:hypothetical protein
MIRRQSVRRTQEAGQGYWLEEFRWPPEPYAKGSASVTALAMVSESETMLASAYRGLPSVMAWATQLRGRWSLGLYQSAWV